MNNSKQIWVSPGGKDSDGKNLWRIHKPDADRDIRVIHGNKTEAINMAQQIARNQGLETKIQNLNGQISGGNSYGNDPCPPKDARP